MKRITAAYTLLAAATLTSAAFFSCGGPDTAVDEKPWEIDREFRRGPVDLRIAVSRKELTIADRIDLLIETRARDGFVTELPRFGDKLHEFGIVDYRSSPPRLEDDGTVTTSRIYELEPFLSGEYVIPPMTVTFHEEGDTTLHLLESDTIRVVVASILPEDMEQLEIREITGPADLPADFRTSVIIGAAAALIVAAAGFYLWRRSRRLKEIYQRAIPAHEKAFARLEALLSEGFVEEKRYSEFTAGVSDILRLYIEDRFGLRAPERTTEEFLAEAGPGLDVDEEKKSILEQFLLHCDLVKFAALEPTSDDVKRTFETCRDFVDATKREEVREEAA
jgi:hypothetical protein